MKSIVYFVLVILSCSGLRNSDFNLVKFQLSDEKSPAWAQLNLEIPSNFDTTYKWVDHSDSYCSESILYRSNSKIFDVVMESGFFHTVRIDSGFYLTVAHSRSIKCDTPYIPKNHSYIDYFKSLSMINSNTILNYTVDSNRIVNGALFDILQYDKIKGHTPFNTVEAIANFSHRNIMIRLENNIHSKDSFYLMAKKMINTIKLKSLP